MAVGDHLGSLGELLQRINFEGPADVSDLELYAHGFYEFEHRRRTQILSGYEPDSASKTSHGIVWPTNAADFTGSEAGGLLPITGAANTQIIIQPGIGVTQQGALCELLTVLTMTVSWTANELNYVVYDASLVGLKNRKNRYNELVPTRYALPETESERVKVYGATAWAALSSAATQNMVIIGAANVDASGTVSSWDYSVRSWFSVGDVWHRSRTDNPHSVTPAQLDLRNQVSYQLGGGSKTFASGDVLPGGRIRIPSDGATLYRWSVSYWARTVSQTNAELVMTDGTTETILSTLTLPTVTTEAWASVESDVALAGTSLTAGQWLVVRPVSTSSTSVLQWPTAHVELLVNTKV